MLPTKSTMPFKAEPHTHSSHLDRLNDTTSGISPLLQDPQTSSAHTAYYLLRATFCRTAQGSALAGSSSTHQHISGNTRRWISRSLVGQRRSEMCGHRQRRGRGCRRRRISRGRRLGVVRRPIRCMSRRACPALISCWVFGGM